MRTIMVAVLLSISPAARLFAQCPDGSAPPCRAPAARATPAPPPNSVAVLYLDNLSPDSTDAYIADGLTEELIARLGQLERLQVRSRTAVQRYRGVPVEDPAGVGRRLNATHLVSGSVRRSGPRLRVTIELVRASSGTRVWGDQYDRTDADLLALQEEIARAVVVAIAGRLLPAERQVLEARPTTSPQAYNHLLRGNFHLTRRTRHDLARAIAEYEAAARLDPAYNAPLARIAYAYALALDWGWDFGGWPRDSLVARAAAAADRALRRDSSLSDAWMATAYVRTYVAPRTFEGVRAAFERAIALDPRNAEAHHQYAFRLIDLGEDSLAEAAFHRALAAEPERAISLIGLSVTSVMARRYDTARRWIDSALAIDPAFAHAYDHRALAHSYVGRHDAALSDLATARQLRRGAANDAVAALVTARAGDTTTARVHVANGWERALGPSVGIDEDVAWLLGALLVLGDCTAALDVVERLGPRGPRLWFVLRTPELDVLRGDQRFQRVLEESRP